MEIEEHFYSDDPAVGHPDVRTRLRDTDYFFLGNGLVQAAVQVCRSGEGTPLGLLVMDPSRFTPKRGALTLDLESGLQQTMVGLLVGDALFLPEPTRLEAKWEETEEVPTVRVGWQAGPAEVVEGSLSVRGSLVHLSVRRTGTGEEKAVRVDGRRIRWSEGDVRLPLPTSETVVEFLC